MSYFNNNNNEKHSCYSLMSATAEVLDDTLQADDENRHKLIEIILERGARSISNKVQLLHDAVAIGCLELVKQLAHRVDVNATINNSTALEVASKRGDRDIVEVLLQTGAQPNTQFKSDELSSTQTAYWKELREIADRLGAREVSEKLLANEATEKINGGQLSALCYACSRGFDKIVKSLIDHGADVNMTSQSNGCSPLQIACEKNHEKIVSLLLRKGANANTQFTGESMSDQQYLHWTELCKLAKGQGKEDIVQVILEGKRNLSKDRFKREPMSALHYACSQGFQRIVELLIHHGAEVNSTSSKDQRTPLEWAIRGYGAVRMVKLLLDQGADANVIFGQEYSALQYSCSSGLHEIAKLLIAYGANVNYRSRGKCTVLESVCRVDNAEIVELLLRRGADPNVPFSDGYSALQEACVRSDETVRILVGHGADVNYRGKYKWSPLEYASWQGKRDIVELLLDNGADANTKFSGGDSALAYACSNGHCGIARLLVDHGADTSDPEVLHRACSQGREDIVELLLRNGSDSNSQFKLDGQDGEVSSALQYACQNQLMGIVKILIRFGADPNTRVSDGRSVLQWAMERRCADGVVYLLLDKGADANVKFSDGESALQRACVEGRCEVVKALAYFGADVNVKNKRGMSVLEFACRQNKVEIVELLLESGADANTRFRCDNSAFQFACLLGLYEIAEILIEHGADIEECGPTRCTPLYVAVKSQNERLVRILLDRGADVNNRGSFLRNSPMFFALRNGMDETVKLLLDRGFDVNQEDYNGCTVMEQAMAREDGRLAEELTGRILRMKLDNLYVSEKNLRAVENSDYYWRRVNEDNDDGFDVKNLKVKVCWWWCFLALAFVYLSIKSYFYAGYVEIPRLS